MCGSAFFFQMGFQRVLPLLISPSLRPSLLAAPPRTTHTDGPPSERYRDSVRRARGWDGAGNRSSAGDAAAAPDGRGMSRSADEGGALGGYDADFGQEEAEPPRDARSVCARRVDLLLVCVCTTATLSPLPLALTFCFLGCRRPSAAVDPDTEVIALFAQLLRQRIWAVPW